MKNDFLLWMLVSNADASLDPLDLIAQAGWVVKGVMILLLLASVVSWTIIFWKWMNLRKASEANHKFAESFWASGSLKQAAVSAKSHQKAPITRVFEAGHQEFLQVTGLGLERDAVIDLLESNVTRSLNKATKIETYHLSKYLSFLATTASSAPFIGLFGTVWGIMTSFINIGATGASNLAVVAPGIAEALIATAMGLFAAIPAGLFYNYFVGQVRSMTSSMSYFVSDFLNTAKRSL